MTARVTRHVYGKLDNCQIVFILQGGILIFSKYLQYVQHLSKRISSPKNKVTEEIKHREI